MNQMSNSYVYISYNSTYFSHWPKIWREHALHETTTLPTAVVNFCFTVTVHEPPMTKPTKWPVRPAKTQISLSIRPVWSESSLSAWRKLGSLTTHWAHSKDFDQTGRMPRLIWVFARRTVILLVLSGGGSCLLIHCAGTTWDKFGF